MVASPALWADVARDLEAARSNAGEAAARARTLDAGGAAMPADVRIDREYAIGVMLHNCYGAMERVLERLVQAIDGDLPTGAAYHADLVRRAARPVNRLRPAIIRRTTAADLQRLRAFRHAFRHVYDGYDYARAAENVPLAERVARQFCDEVEAFATTIGLRPSDDVCDARDD